MAKRELAKSQTEQPVPRHSADSSTTSSTDNTTSSQKPSGWSQAIGRTRFIVALAVAAVMLIAGSLFLLGAWQAVVSVWNAWYDALHGGVQETDLAVEFLATVSIMLKAVVFYLIGVGLYSLFIAPLNLAVSLGVQTLSDLESKVVSVVIVIMAVTFLEKFILWREPLETLQFGAALAIVVAALVLFQFYSHKVREDQQTHQPDIQARAKRELFDEQKEKQAITKDQEQGMNRDG